MSSLIFENVCHRYDGINSVDIDRLEVGTGRLVCLLGPSGCGKSTTLRLAAGLERPYAGRIHIAGEVMADERVFIGPENRRVGLVFQDYALFPHLTVLDNVAFGLSDLAAGERRARALQMLETVRLVDAAKKYPHMLSGGEQQRVALARALAPNPRLILMDEPFSGLDVVLRNRVRDETLALLKDMGTTVLMVTHDPEEAMRMADEIVLMQKGRIVQQGSAGALYNYPANAFVASFLGDVNRVPARRMDNAFQTDLGSIPVSVATKDIMTDELLIRPEAIRLLPVVDPSQPTAEVILSRNLGAYALVDLKFPSGVCVTARMASFSRPEAGDRCSLSLNPEGVFIFPGRENDEIGDKAVSNEN
ncbi:MAG: ABC transporter ATP-binding protein [Sneathiella sp.]|jgi:iron(III) transport system ATP-binding protein|uniref:ABC transporter ATP-binding protein n=1 Tax=Sneathiella sp. TaxID=1964365 RepID=UPI000C5FC2DE|nr:ABC transporter ATP-binding protein [Sneathiella sp.]MAL80172.1 ABC transporter ATP-binding protein [Sneathiella sp.]